MNDVCLCLCVCVRVCDSCILVGKHFCLTYVVFEFNIRLTVIVILCQIVFVCVCVVSV